MADRIEHRLGELGEAAPEAERARARTLVSDARQATRENGPPDRIHLLIDELRGLETVLCARETPAGEICGGLAAGVADAQPVDEPAADVMDPDFRPG